MWKSVVSSVLIAAMVCGTLIGCGTTQTKEKETTASNAELKKIADHLEEVTYDSLDYDYAKTYFEKYKGEVTSGCTSVYKDGMLMRNFDWSLKYNGVDVSEVVVHTKATDDTYATVGVAYSPKVTDDNYDFLSDEEQKIVPFTLTDGMNSEGLMVSQNVVPENDEISNTYGTNPDGEDLCSHMITRSLIDHCANVDEAIEYLKDHNFYMGVKYTETKTESDYRQESHYLIADKDRAVIVEFVDNEMRVLEQDDLPYDTVFITNHYLYNGAENTGHGL